MEKKSLASKKTAPVTKSSSKKVDTSKPAASKVVAAKRPSSGGPIQY
jgi:hypothetical protein